MADIFISYSRRDSVQAKTLADRLRAAGANVWMDTAALAAAETWSAEIVSAINNADIFILLLSPNSVASHNVNKELSLASEKRKTIIPIVIEKCPLSQAMEYALAGLQRVSIADEEALERSFAKLGISASGLSQTIKEKGKVRNKSSVLLRYALPLFLLIIIAGTYLSFNKKNAEAASYGFQVHRVAVLPLESLGKADDEIADGITSEAIHTLSQLFGVAVTDRKTVMAYKGKKTDVKTAAKELNVDYIVDGTVQLNGKNVRVSAQLTDAASGKILLSEHFDGSTEDILSLEEHMGQAIGFELQFALGGSQLNIQRFPISKNAEAVRLKDDATSMVDTASRETQIAQAMSLYQKALELDPKYMAAMVGMAKCYQRRFEYISHAPRDLVIADSLLTVAQKMDTSAYFIHRMFEENARLQEDSVREEFEGKELVRLQPNDPFSYSALCNYYMHHRRWEVVTDIDKILIKRDIANLSAWRNLIIAYNELRDTSHEYQTIRMFLPLLARYLTKREDDTKERVQSGYYFALIGKRSEAEAELKKAFAYQEKWSEDEYYNSGCAYALIGDIEPAIEMLAHSIVLVPSNRDGIKTDPDLTSLLKHPGVEEKILLRAEELKKKRVNG